MGRARKHAIFGCHPTLALAFKKRGYALFQGGGDQHLGVAKAYEARAFGVACDAGFQRDGTHLVGLAIGGAEGF